MISDYFCPKDCPNRKPKCHGSCERHKKYQEENEATKEAKRKEGMKHQAIERPYLTRAKIKKKAR